MSPRGNGRWLLWISAAGAIAALAGVVVSWKSLLMRHHLEQLRRDPTALPAFLEAPDGTVKKMAGSAFAREPLGMVSQFVDHFEKARARTLRERGRNPARGINPYLEGRPGTLREVDRAIVGFRGGAQVRGNWTFWGEFRWQKASQNGWFFSERDDAIVTLAERLGECHGASIDLPHYPGLRVEVLPLESALERARGWTAPWEGQPRRRPRGYFHGSWAPVDGSKPAQDSVLLFSRIPQ